MEVTNEMLKVARSMQSFELMIKRIIELHEANKPKPEPVGYMYPSAYEKALSNESSCEMYVVPVTNMHTGEESSISLYTNLPTREPYTGERVICAAVMLNDKLYCGYRHANIYNQCFGTYLNGIEGFITTDNGRFVDRKEAWLIADKAGQIINRGEGIDGLLFSENLY